MTITRKKSRAIFTPANREAIKALKGAICSIYEITEPEFMNDSSTAVAYLRFYCFWILAKKLSFKDSAIGEVFSKARTTVQYGIEQVDGQKDIYREKAAELQMIINTANEYPKKFEWCIQSINSTN